MKISKSKQELARIISENCGWINTACFAAQDHNSVVTFFVDKPWRCDAVWECENFEAAGGFGVTEAALKNWYQTILSRDEYFHLYPVPDAKPEFCESVMRSIPEPSDKPTIEQLSADYHSLKGYADRKQKEADDAKADADAKLADLVAAGKELGLELSVADPEPELVITDWRDLRVGDEVECIKSNVYPHKYKGMIGTVLEVDDSSTPYLVDFGGAKRIWCSEVRFIRRP